MTKRKKIEFSKDTHLRNNMEVDVYRFPAKSINLIKEKITLTEEQKSSALDKIIDANPNYHELPPEEQYGLIVTTLTLESILYWIMGSGQARQGGTMYQAYMEGTEVAVIEIFYVKNEKNAKIIDNAFKSKSKKAQTISFPKSKVAPAKGKGKPADIIQLRKD